MAKHLRIVTYALALQPGLVYHGNSLFSFRIHHECIFICPVPPTELSHYSYSTRFGNHFTFADAT